MRVLVTNIEGNDIVKKEYLKECKKIDKKAKCIKEKELGIWQEYFIEMEINTLEELLELQKQIKKQLIIDEYSKKYDFQIEIYDNYRE